MKVVYPICCGVDVHKSWRRWKLKRVLDLLNMISICQRWRYNSIISFEVLFKVVKTISHLLKKIVLWEILAWDLFALRLHLFSSLNFKLCKWEKKHWGLCPQIPEVYPLWRYPVKAIELPTNPFIIAFCVDWIYHII